MPPFVPDPTWPAVDSTYSGSDRAQHNGPRAAAGQHLPAAAVPFPVVSPFVVRADLQKIPVGEPLIRRDGEYPRYARARLAGLLAGDSDWLLAPSADPAAALRALEETVDLLLADTAGRRQLGSAAGLVLETAAGRLAVRQARPDAAGLADWLMQRCDRERSREHRDLRLLATLLALDLQEDFVLMAPAGGLVDPKDEVRAEGLFVSFPSGWAPQEKIGQALSAIHAPVADGQALRRASPGLSMAMLHKGPFVRHVWTLSDSFRLDRHPVRRYGASEAPGTAGRMAAGEGTDDLSSIAFRCERQVTLALPRSGRALFLIRVYVTPLPEAANSPERRARLVDSLRSMSDAVVEYKNIGPLRERVLAAWG